MLLTLILGIPLLIAAHICERILPDLRFRKHMIDRRPRPHTFA